ncbi:hypothetical protein GCM10027047_05870 [Rhodococcus aerolatus]
MPERREPDAPVTGRERARSGPGRVLVAVYAVFALSAGARSVEQIATKFSLAPVPFLLSALAAVVYLVATVALVRGWLGVALVAVVVELVGVLAVGTTSVLLPAEFPEATVWSEFGAGYGFVPVLLPLLGIAWLVHLRRGAARR